VSLLSKHRNLASHLSLANSIKKRAAYVY